MDEPAAPTPPRRRLIDVVGLLVFFTICSFGIPLLFLFTLPLSLLAMCLAAVYAGWVMVVYGERSHRWPQVPGRILTSAVAKTDSFAGRNRSVTYAPEITYEFEFEGRRHIGTRVSFADSRSSSPQWAERLQAAYPVGAEVRVYVEPGNPEFTVLRPGRSWWGLPIMLFGLVGVAGAVAMYVRVLPMHPVAIPVRDAVCILAYVALLILRRRREGRSKGR